MEIKLNNTLEVDIEKVAYGGRGIARVNKFVIFVPLTVPGDKAKIKITKKKSNHAVAELVDLISPSEHRVTAPCRVFHDCGGCSWQNVNYHAQLKFKEQILHSTIEHLAGVNNIDMHPIVPSPEIWHYRNKMDYTFSSDDSKNVKIGFHKLDNYQEVVDVKRCFLHPQSFDQILEIVRDFAQYNKLSCYDPKTHDGLLRHLIVRASKSTGDIIAVLLTNDKGIRDIEPLSNKILDEVDSAKGFIWGINSRLSDVALMDEVAYKAGRDHIVEHIDGMKFKISPFSFFQTNSAAAAQLYCLVRELAELSGNETLLDAYCGTGTIALFCSGLAKNVYGIDSVVQSVWDARTNAALNKRTNCLFLAAEMKKGIPLLLSFINDNIERIIVDPPRTGMDKKSLRAIIALNAPLIIYVSCNPTTLARDCISFKDAGYQLKSLHPVDMFPHTYHIEAVAKFVK